MALELGFGVGVGAGGEVRSLGLAWGLRVDLLTAKGAEVGVGEGQARG